MAIWQEVIACLTQHLQQNGFCIVHAFPVQLFNSQSPVENQLPTFSRPESTLAVIIGNTNTIWMPFLRHLATHQDAQAAPDPLDAYVEQHVTAAVQHCCQLAALQPQHNACHAQQSLTSLKDGEPVQVRQADQLSIQQPHNHSLQDSNQLQKQHTHLRFELRFSHHFGAKFINMLRAAQLSGLAYYSPKTHLCMHPTYGPWFALRAVVVFDCDGPDPRSFTQLSCAHPDLEEQAGKAMKQLESLGGLANWQQHWRQWADLRTLGGKYTDPRYCYSADQLEYHYTKSKAVLAAAINKQKELQENPDYETRNQPPKEES